LGDVADLSNCLSKEDLEPNLAQADQASLAALKQQQATVTYHFEDKVAPRNVKSRCLPREALF
jgi:hypothetical protein